MMITDSMQIAAVVLFIWACFWEGMIFSSVADWLQADLETDPVKPPRYRMPEWALKPLISCPICMAFWWGWAIALLMGASLFSVATLFTVMGAGGICATIVLFKSALMGLTDAIRYPEPIHEYMEVKREEYEN